VLQLVEKPRSADEVLSALQEKPDQRPQEQSAMSHDEREESTSTWGSSETSNNAEEDHELSKMSYNGRRRSPCKVRMRIRRPPSERQFQPRTNIRRRKTFPSAGQYPTAQQTQPDRAEHTRLDQAEDTRQDLAVTAYSKEQSTIPDTVHSETNPAVSLGPKSIFQVLCDGLDAIASDLMPLPTTPPDKAEKPEEPPTAFGQKSSLEKIVFTPSPRRRCSSPTPPGNV
jgi:hypothetical protein